MADLQKLKTELSKPEYAGLSDESIAKKLRQHDRLVNRETIDSGSLVVAIFPGYSTLTADQKETLTFLSRAQTITIDKALRDFLSDLFPDGPFRKRLRDALKRPGSVADEQGIGSVNESDVADAKRLP